MIIERIKAAIRDVPDFPTPGVMFKDITPILMDPQLCSDVVDEFSKKFSGNKVDAIVGVESRGFLFGMLLAQKMNVPFITVRKMGKLPYKTISYEYDLEYGSSTMEMHTDALKKGWNVMVHDDLLATGGTAAAAATLIKMQQANIAGFSFLIALDFLKGKEKLSHFVKTENIISLVNF